MYGEEKVRAVLSRNETVRESANAERRTKTLQPGVEIEVGAGPPHVCIERRDIAHAETLRFHQNERVIGVQTIRVDKMDELIVESSS